MALSTPQLAQMRYAHGVLMGDTCQIGTYAAGTADGFGQVKGSYTYATAISCGFEWKGTDEKHTAAINTYQADAILRTPHTTSVAVRDRVKLTYRYGTDITDLTFEVVGVGLCGPTATLVYLKQVSA
jgi:hypothetical protein